MEKLYPDVSHYHPVTDWNKVKKNCPFLISKATEGTSYIDSILTDFISGCEKNRIPYWLYTYLKKGSELSQAKFLVSTCKEKVGDFFVGYALDAEDGNSAANVESALAYLDSLGGKTLLYTAYARYETYKALIMARPSDCAWWESRYGENTGSFDPDYPPHSCDLHQYTSMGTCAGIHGSCDLNRIVGSKTEEWFKIAKSTSAASGMKTDTAASAGVPSGEKKVLLTVDGKWGTATCERAQTVFGTTRDGYISGQPTSLKKYHAGISCAKYAAGGTGSRLVKAIQRKVGVVRDGKLGPVTIRAMQKWLGTVQDGTISNPSLMVRAFQIWLNIQ